MPRSTGPAAGSGSTATAGVVAAHGTSIAVKRVVRRPRPHDPRVAVHVGTPSRLSFPSSHATSTTAAAVLFGGLLGRPGAVLPTVPAMALSRLVLGVHYPTDVLAGIRARGGVRARRPPAHRARVRRPLEDRMTMSQDAKRRSTRRTDASGSEAAAGSPPARAPTTTPPSSPSTPSRSSEPEDAPDDDAVPVRRTGPLALPLGVLKTMRPKQWVKNVLVLAAPFAAGRLGEVDVLLHVVVAFAAFSLAASGVYLVNDARDVEADRAHPKKRFRPIAAGIVPAPVALRRRGRAVRRARSR